MNHIHFFRSALFPCNLLYCQHKRHAYRDRAAERRILHGGIGVGPGQKSVLVGDNGGELYPDSASTEDATAEALEMSFGTGSYARRILESMGWKEVSITSHCFLACYVQDEQKLESYIFIETDYLHIPSHYSRQ